MGVTVTVWQMLSFRAFPSSGKAEVELAGYLNADAVSAGNDPITTETLTVDLSSVLADWTSAIETAIVGGTSEFSGAAIS